MTPCTILGGDQLLKDICFFSLQKFPADPSWWSVSKCMSLILYQLSVQPDSILIPLTLIMKMEAAVCCEMLLSAICQKPENQHMSSSSGSDSISSYNSVDIY
jgi:hypothetical protein